MLAGQLPHLKAVREKATQQHEKNRARISRTRKGKGKQPVQPFTVGEDIVMQPARKGKVGNPIGPKRIPARVVGVSKPNGQLKYNLRTNTGVLPSSYFHGQLRKAVPGRPDAPSFEGAEVAGVRVTSEREARGNTVRCGCRSKGGKCGNSCPCKKGGHKCARHCGCKHGKGGNCGNC